jgi:hypothetical protein
VIEIPLSLQDGSIDTSHSERSPVEMGGEKEVYDVLDHWNPHFDAVIPLLNRCVSADSRHRASRLVGRGIKSKKSKNSPGEKLLSRLWAPPPRRDSVRERKRDREICLAQSGGNQAASLSIQGRRSPQLYSVCTASYPLDAAYCELTMARL